MSETQSDIAAVLAALGEVSGQIHVLDTDRDDKIRAARAAGASWTQIGEALGISKQSAWERYRKLEEAR